MRLRACREEARPGRENEVAGHPLPYEMKIVVIAPHVLSGAHDPVHMLAWIVGGQSGMAWATDVVLRSEDADGGLCSDNCAEQHEAQYLRDNAECAGRPH